MIQLRWVQDTRMVQRLTTVGAWVQEREPFGPPVLQFSVQMNVVDEDPIAGRLIGRTVWGPWRDVPTVGAIDGVVL